MAARTPVTQGTAGFCPPESFFGTFVSATSDVISTTANIHKFDGLRFSCHYFADVDDDDTWTSNIPNIIGCFTCGDVHDDDHLTAAVTTQATGVITFGVETEASSGWVLLIRGV